MRYPLARYSSWLWSLPSTPLSLKDGIRAPRASVGFSACSRCILRSYAAAASGVMPGGRPDSSACAVPTLRIPSAKQATSRPVGRRVSGYLMEAFLYLCALTNSISLPSQRASQGKCYFRS